jgi:predicted transcriptional regulator
MAMTLRLTEEQDTKLDLLASELKVSKQQALVHLIETTELANHRQARLREIFDKVMVRDAELMERLADA